MIRYLEKSEKRRSEALYREAFPEDKDAFVEYYYEDVTKNNRILAEERDGEICSMLHLNPYRISVNGEAVDAYYYVAVATKEAYRHRGMMRSLLSRSLRDIHDEGHPFAYLMPADRAIYEPFGFRIVYEQKKIELPDEPQAANEKLAKLFDVYTLRDEQYMERMLKEEKACEGEEPFDIVPYIMMRLTNIGRMFSLLRGRRPGRAVLRVTDGIIPENNGVFAVIFSESGCRLEQTEEEAKISADIAELTEWVFGKRKIKGLEAIRTLDRICINEAV